MKTLPREPWRGGQICGEQLSTTTWTSRASYCGEPKKAMDVICEEHWNRYIAEDGEMPDFAEGNAVGHFVQQSVLDGRWRVYDGDNEALMGEADTEEIARRIAGQHILQWEGDDGKPEAATPEEIAAWEAS